MGWAQQFAHTNRELMMEAILECLTRSRELPSFRTEGVAVNCHHNYVQRETHFGEELSVTRKGAVSARKGELGIIPGSMGARSYIVRGKGHPESFHSCSHGAGRAMSRTEARRRFSISDHERATEGIECRKDAGVLDETPMAYTPIDRGDPRASPVQSRFLPYRNAKISATARYAATGISAPTCRGARHCKRSGSRSMGMPCSSALAIMFAATSPPPFANTRGALSSPRSYPRAAAWVGFLPSSRMDVHDRSRGRRGQHKIGYGQL